MTIRGATAIDTSMADLGDSVDHRYEETAGTYRLTTWYYGALHGTTNVTGLIEKRPSWLEDIVNVARIGGHIRDVAHSPPDQIVWFRTNPDHVLITFINFTDGPIP